MEKSAPQGTSLTHETFARFVEHHRFAVIHFWAAWNAVDFMMFRLLGGGLPHGLPETLALGNFDADSPGHHAICRQHGFTNLPALAFYREGNLMRLVVGMRPHGVIADYMEELVAPPSDHSA